MAESILHVSRREDCGKGAARALRRRELIPAVFYGKGLETCSLTVDPKELRSALATEAGMNTLIRLQGDGPFDGTVVILKDVQRDALSRQFLHADFQVIDLTRKTTISVPVRIVGKAEGEKVGGILQQIVKELEIRCLPSEIPPFIEIDVTSLGIGDAIHVDEVVFPANAESTHEESFAVVSVAAPIKEEEEEAEGAEEEAAEAEGEKAESKEEED